MGKKFQDNSKLQIRNSTVDFLVFTRDANEDGIDVYANLNLGHMAQ